MEIYQNKQTNKKKIALIHPEIKGGGGEAVLAWALEALKNIYDITLISIDDIDISFMNSFYKTNLDEGEFKVFRVYPFASIFSKRFYILKRHLIMRYCKKNTKQFDLLFSTQNEMDFGVVGIQYIHFPVHIDNLLLSKEKIFKKKSQRSTKIHNMYRQISKMTSNFNVGKIKQNITLVNSAWTGEITQQVYGIKSKVVFPPVLSDSSLLSWENRKNSFVCIGWIRPEKNIEKIIKILSQVRQRGHKINLHIVGPVWDKTYFKYIKNLARCEEEWIRFHGQLKRKELIELVSQNRFGIHAFQNEHFGIAVAEMVKTGSIVFVPNGGGQREIVNHDQRFIYNSIPDAVEKIISVLNNPNSQEKISNEMYASGRRFSSELFMRQIQDTVQEVIENAL
jgi:glycosyltransferase involved in cell wall biosynthesis